MIALLEAEIASLELDSTELQSEPAELKQRCLDADVGTRGTSDDPNYGDSYRNYFIILL